MKKNRGWFKPGKKKHQKIKEQMYQQEFRPSSTYSSTATKLVIPQHCDLGFSNHVLNLTIEKLDYVCGETPHRTFDMKMWWEIVAFFAEIDRRNASEAQVRLYFNRATKRWDRVAYKQSGDRGLFTEQTMEDRPERLRSGEWHPNGSVHSHCKVGAFQSGTDHADECGSTGVHITVGHIDRPKVDLHGRVYFGRILVPIHWTSIFEVPARDEMIGRLLESTNPTIRDAAARIDDALVLDLLSNKPNPMPDVPEDLLAAISTTRSTTVYSSHGYQSSSVGYGSNQLDGNYHFTGSYSYNYSTNSQFMRSAYDGVIKAWETFFKWSREPNGTPLPVFSVLLWGDMFECLTNIPAGIRKNVSKGEAEGMTLRDAFVRSYPIGAKIRCDVMSAYSLERYAYTNGTNAGIAPPTAGFDSVHTCAMIMLETLLNCDSEAVFEVLESMSIYDIRKRIKMWGEANTAKEPNSHELNILKAASESKAIAGSSESGKGLTPANASDFGNGAADWSD